MTAAVDHYFEPLLTKVQALIRRALNLVTGPAVDPQKKDRLMQMLREKATQLADKKDPSSWKLHKICQVMSHVSYIMSHVSYIMSHVSYMS